MSPLLKINKLALNHSFSLYKYSINILLILQIVIITDKKTCVMCKQNVFHIITKKLCKSFFVKK